MSAPIYLFIVPFFPSDTCHGGSYIYDQVKAIAATGKYRVIVLLGTSNIEGDGDYEFEGITIFRFREHQLPSMLWQGFYDKKNIEHFKLCLNRLNISCKDIEVVHAHVIRQGLYANYVKEQNPKVLSILQHHGYDVLGLDDGKFAKYRWHRRHALTYGIGICNKIDLHVGVSAATLKVLKQYKGLTIKDSYVLYNGINNSLFHPLDRQSHKDFTIGCVSNFWKIKDQITLIKAVESVITQNKYIKVYFVGVGATLSECKDYVDNHGLSNCIEFLQPMPHDKLIKFYNSLDLFVLPSYWDTLGCVYLEAYACGIPFMTAEGTGIKELIPESDYPRWVAPRSNPEKLAQMILNFIKYRYPQKLTISIDIDSLIGNFLNYIDKKINPRP